MIKGRVSVIIPACNENFIQATIDSLLDGVHGDVEIIPVIDGGPWPASPNDRFLHDPHVVVLRNTEQLGMRQSFNAAAEVATGEFLMKCDGHCIFAPGWDAVLKADCDGDWLVVPTRHSIDGEAWKAHPREGQKAVRMRHFNYHYLTFPYMESMYGYGLHGKTFSPNREQRHVPSVNTRVNALREQYLIDDLMSFQGSCWFTPAASFRRLGPLDHASYYFYSESIETGMRQWASGGRVVINKKTWYAHYHKGNNNLHTIDGRIGRGFFLNVRRKRDSEAYATDFWMNDRWPNTVLTFEKFIDRFAWLMALLPAGEQWPTDWQDPKHRHDFLNRPPDQIPAHI